jgi:hypothetical protein
LTTDASSLAARDRWKYALVEMLVDQAKRVKEDSVDVPSGDRDHSFVNATCGQ